MKWYSYQERQMFLVHAVRIQISLIPRCSSPNLDPGSGEAEAQIIELRSLLSTEEAQL